MRTNHYMGVYSGLQQSELKRAADAATVRAHNMGLLLNLTWEAGNISRADLARESGLSRSTVSDIVASFLEQGLLCESHVARSTGGRPPIALQFNEEVFRMIGVELGASHVSALVADVRGKARVVFHHDFDVQGDPQGALRVVERLIERCLQTLPSGNRVVGIGVAVPCPVDPRAPDQLSVRILPRWSGVRLGSTLHARFGLPVFLDNDANLGALAERWWGAGQQIGDFAYVKVATGVGAGIIINGRIYRGSGGIAGEIGHSAIDAAGPRCRCGLFGCLESLVGTQALLDQVQERAAQFPDSALSSLPSPALADLVSAAAANDPLAREIIARAGHALGVAFANLLNLYNPARVIVGGSLTRAGEALLLPVRAAIRQRALWDSINEHQVVISPLGEEAIALGAATQVLAEALAEPSLFPPLESP